MRSKCLRQVLKATVKILGESVEVRREENRLRLVFDGKPAEAIRKELKARAFKFARSQGAWQRQLTGNAEYALKQLIAA